MRGGSALGSGGARRPGRNAARGRASLTYRLHVPIRKPKDIALPTHEITNLDRRKHLRFPLDTELRYQICGIGHSEPIRGTGQVENISSKGLAFRADRPLKPGCQVSVSLAWPAKLDDQCMLRLALEGVVLRIRGNLVVLTIQRQEFRTAGRSTAAARDEVAAIARGIESLCPTAQIMLPHGS